MLREDAGMVDRRPAEVTGRSRGLVSEAAREVLAAWRRSGPCSSAILARLTTGCPSESEDALWELVAAGLVTADGFENLRALIDPKRRGGRSGRPRHSAGRWALVCLAIPRGPIGWKNGRSSC